MKTRRALGLVFLFSAVWLPVHADENEKCGLKQVASLDLAQFAGHVLVPVTIQGKSVWVSLHTGSPGSGILDDEARALQLHRQSVFVPTLTSEGTKRSVVVPGGGCLTARRAVRAADE